MKRLNIYKLMIWTSSRVIMNKNQQLMTARMQCEKLLYAVAIACEIKKKEDPYSRIYQVIIEETYRMWTDVLCMLYYSRDANIWNIGDESLMINQPSSIPCVIKRVSQELRLANRVPATQ